MHADDLFRRIGDALGVRRVFGEPVERDGVTVIPVAMVAGGGGGGAGLPGTPGDGSGDGFGGGFGGWSRGIGVFTVRDGEVRFVPATDRTLLLVVALLVWGRIMMRIVRRARRAP